MLYSLLSDENMYFIDLHAECALHTYSSEFFHNDIISNARMMKGIYCKKVNSDILNNIYMYEYEKKDLCINFAGIEEITDNNLLSFVTFIKRKICARNKTVYLINLNRKLYNPNIKSVFRNVEQADGMVTCLMGNAKTTYSYVELMKTRERLFNEKLEDMVIEASEDCSNSTHMSVPVYLSRYINLKKMSENNTSFLRLSIYYLAMKLVEKSIVSKDPLENSNLSLFFHTVNGGYIATQLAQLFHIDLVYLDHLGPIESVHRKHFEKSIRDNRNYIIVSDVICLGGEIGRARTIIEYFGGTVLGEVSLVDIKTIQSERVDSRISLYTISNTCNKIGYTIKTDLCSMCGKEDSK